MKPVTLATLKSMKQAGEKIAVLTAYDYSFATVLERVGMDIILVGDSLGMVIQGHDSTLPVQMQDMIYHSSCVARACHRSLLMVDMPFMSYHLNPQQAMGNAGRLMQEGGAHMVKLEGGAHMAETIHFLVERGVPVCAHLGLMPQSVHQLGGFRVQGKQQDSAARLRADAVLLQQAGAAAVLLEAVPATLAKAITADLDIPTIGIGAGPDCDGQVLVLQDVLGVYGAVSPKFAKNFLHGQENVEAAVRAYAEAVRTGNFPGPEHGY